MTPRRLEDRLIVLALALAAFQVLLLAALQGAPEPPEALPPPELPDRARARSDEPPSPNDDRATVELLDRLLADRVRAAASRRGVDPGPLLPRAAVRDAALAAPDPRGPAVDGLIQAYVAALNTLGETLDAATSIPATATSP